MMQNILSRFYCGNLRPADKEVLPQSPYAKRARDLERCAEKLEQCIGAQEKALFRKYVTLDGRLDSIEVEEYYIDGFCTGAQIMLEILTRQSENLRPFD